MQPKPSRRARHIGLCALLAVLLHFTMQATATVPGNCLKLSKVFTSYDALRRGETFDMHLTLRASRCLVTTLNDVHDLNSLVRINADPSLTFRVIGAGSTQIERLSGGSAAENGARERTLDLRVASAPDSPVGVQHVSLLLNYEAIDEQGRRTPQSVVIDLLVKIVGPDAPIKRQWDSPKWTPLEIVLIPIRLIELVFWDGC